MFFAYPNAPEKIGLTIEAAANKINTSPKKVKTWRVMPIAGSFIRTNVIESIRDSDVLIADITKLNFNVTYEIGYAIGRKKAILLVKNISLEPSEELREVGIFDTIGYREYSNSDQLYEIIYNYSNENALFDLNSKLNKQAPVYLLEPKYKTDDAIRITTRIKKARYIYRSFDPNEMPRLSSYDAIDQVAQSLGVLVSLLAYGERDAQVHNTRAAFIIGLSHGMDKATCILQRGNDPIPLDYRDLVNSYNLSSDIDNYIAEFASNVAEAFQTKDDLVVNRVSSFLQQVDLGSSAAENEMRFLESYYLKTDAYLKTLRGDVQLVVGRKGSGKTAIFLQIRDRERSKSSNVVLDLKPEGYKLVKFKESVLSFLQTGTFQHTISAFWEYIILLEICHKILNNDKKRHVNDSNIFDFYKKLEDAYQAEGYLTEGDFSERMNRLIDNLTNAYREKYGEGAEVRLSTPEITDLIYKSDIRSLRSALISYLKKKEKLWVLLDNIDKGWPSSGLQADDIMIIRTLIDAMRNIQRQFNRERIDMYPVVFLRNDVYELLMEQTADRQKEAKEILDWVDPDLLRELLKLRIVSNSESEGDNFEEIWRTVFVSHYRGEETSQYLIDRSLMRPRFLINLVNHCKSCAVNFQHSKVEVGDIEKGFSAYSVDLLTDINYEIRDIFPEAENILYVFIESKQELNLLELISLLKSEISDEKDIEKIIDLLLWYGFLGIRSNLSETRYIYNFNYNMSLLRGVMKKKSDELVYAINPAFWPSLFIEF